MAKISAGGAAALFEQIVGWPYASPGTNDQRGIDCSGAWVRVYKAYGKSVYHGSNTIFRKHCSQTGRVTGDGDLCVGMAVFKHRADGGEPSQYHGDGIGNLYHIGCVTAVNPLRIIHATTPVAKLDTSSKAWTHWGLMTEVDYAQDAPADAPVITLPEAPAEKELAYLATVDTVSGSLNMRTQPNLQGPLITRIPREAQVEVLRDPAVWLLVRYSGKTGYCMQQFLRRSAGG
ncbi:MAG: SH3 domain-containing protein [Oscillospiraceae bacterium]|jgi:hypothetical protein|nr:SH3 domain-containing protein [Oscillospiraceae bacterium]